jgi:hypothetical protein
MGPVAAMPRRLKYFWSETVLYSPSVSSALQTSP